MSKFTICFDTLCTGWQPVNFNDAPAEFPDAASAQAEIDSDPEFYADCFVAELAQIGSKAIYTGGNHAAG